MVALASIADKKPSPFPTMSVAASISILLPATIWSNSETLEVVESTTTSFVAVTAPSTTIAPTALKSTLPVSDRVVKTPWLDDRVK